MTVETIRVRLMRLPRAKDFEYFALRYLRVNGVYEVPLGLAHDLIESECALPCNDSDPLTDVWDSLPHISEDDAD
jgi:hypothetical protein